MSVDVNKIEPVYSSEDVVLESFDIMDGIKDFLNSKLPADISYFDHNKINEIFREIDKNGGKSEDYAFVLYSIIINIGNAARQPSSLDKCYKASVRYKRTVIEYFNKYKSKLSVDSKKKLRHAVESQFKHFQINPIKDTLKMLKVPDLPLKALNLTKDAMPGSMVNSSIDVFLSRFAIKYYDLLEAVRMYKKAANSEADWDDLKAHYTVNKFKEEANYFYEIARAVLEDMLKVYDQL